MLKAMPSIFRHKKFPDGATVPPEADMKVRALDTYYQEQLSAAHQYISLLEKQLDILSHSQKQGGQGEQQSDDGDDEVPG